MVHSEGNKKAYGVKYAGEGATSVGHLQKNQETALVRRLLLRGYSFHCTVVLQLMYQHLQLHRSPGSISILRSG